MKQSKAALTAGDHLRAWRQRRRMSQLHFALEAEVSQRHLSFLESGRATPSRDMLLHLAERLDVPLRDRNAMLLAAGFAPVYAERNLEDPDMSAAREAVERVLKGHEPFPALAVDRHWHLVDSNSAVAPLLAGVDSALLRSPVNVLRLSLHPDGLSPRIANLAEWRTHVLDRLRRQIAVTNDEVLAELLRELSDYPASNAVSAGQADVQADHGGVFVPFKLMTGSGVLSFLSTTTVFGTPRDITLSELAVEAFFPADEDTARIIREGINIA